ncbi:hypothetical protein D3C76_1067130 [compost metagenome]
MLGIVTLRVDADRHQLHLGADPRTQPFLHLAHDRGHHRADRGAAGVDETHDHDLVAHQVFFQADDLAVLVQQGHVGKLDPGSLRAGLFGPHVVPGVFILRVGQRLADTDGQQAERQQASMCESVHVRFLLLGIAGYHPNAGKGLVIETRAQGRRPHVQVPGTVLIEGHRGLIDAVGDFQGGDLLRA